MAEPFLGEIKIFGFNFAPRSWAFCDGQILPINQNQSLFSLLGTTYGGDGRTTFALPDLRGRLPLHEEGTNYRLGQKSGEENHFLSTPEMPQHTHAASANSAKGTQTSSSGKFWAQDSQGLATYATAGTVNLGSNAIIPAGGGQAHSNTMPSLVLNFCIALQGIFPSRN